MASSRHGDALSPGVRSATALLGVAVVVAASVGLVVQAVAMPVGHYPAVGQAGDGGDFTEAEWRRDLENVARGGPVPPARTVDGRPVDVSVLGDGPVAPDRALAALGGSAATAPPAGELRSRAASILDQPAYGGEQQSLLNRLLFNNPIADWLRDAWNRFVRWFGERFSFGGGDAQDPDAVDPDRSSYGIPLLIAVAIGAALLSWFVIRRNRAQLDPEIEWFDAIPEGLRSRTALEAAAEEAVQRGDLAGAIRFRFLAALVTLDESDRIRLRPSMRMSELRSELASVEFDLAASLFESAVYSSHSPTSADVAAHEDAWRSVLGRQVGV